LILSGVLVGSVYGLIAMGFVIVYRSSRVFNMAYGQFAVLGSFVAWTFMGSPNAPRLPVSLALFLTLLFAIAFGLLVERVLFRRMIGRPLFSSFILTLGMLALFNSIVMIVWGPNTLVFAQTVPKGPVNIGGIVLAKEYIWTFFIAVAIVIAFVFFFRRTKLGLAIRAAYDHQVAAQCLGVSARLNSQIAWCLCTVLATAGGILVASVQGASVILAEIVMVTLAIVLVGGLESMEGCILGGLVLAIGENLAIYYLASYLPGVGGVVGVVLILLVLIIRPSGLFGTKPVERV
ncbi:MAG: branched-chain amino acid ABC transporter permease, partial [Dehalococcoidia bacterium]|nr:branched-chain amino acid ABC transporter permease [Dehalococcoidia bacterium]